MLLPRQIPDGAGPGLAYRIEGELVPVLHLALNGQLPVFFEHHVVLWKQPQIDVRIKPLKGAFKRVLAGMPIFMTEAAGAGEIAFSRDSSGHVFPLHLPHGATILVREHQFLAATGNLGYTFERAGGIGSMLFGQQGFFIDRFTAQQGDAVLWLHAHGNAFQVDLAPGEVIDVEPGRTPSGTRSRSSGCGPVCSAVAETWSSTGSPGPAGWASSPGTTARSAGSPTRVPTGAWAACSAASSAGSAQPPL